VDGETWVFKQSESLGDQFFTCTVSADSIDVNFQTDSHDLSFQSRLQESGEWFGPVTVAPTGVQGAYGSIPNVDGGSFAIAGQSAVYTGRFRFATYANPADPQDVGDGRVAVTCP
jgi:hypothetical protein